MSALIKVVDLTKTYETDGAKTPVLHGVNLEVPKGQFVAIMGPSGSGKSTFMHILGFLDTLTTGKYYFDGEEISTFDEDEQAVVRGERVGFIFQAFNLLPKTSVLENVMLPLLYSDVPVKDRTALAMEAIKLVGLEHRANNLSNQLSGGERQRVAIARTLVRKPAVIFADEPTGNLDSKSGKIVMDTLLELNMRHGHTIILVTHEKTTAQYAERIITMKDGLVVGDEVVKNRIQLGSEYSK
ncbi:MAG: ABC transporter ATP-binding protein [Candidatus Magasanikbacteria bacterium]|nr:ABC transporter ATP-binding protein [Candidatus Magasanikbacteria bacterium]MCA9390870.1 ABC transporter ATP-binding protein [Candidatus Magasanikbacteria bacterium]USN52185.1 MAG: ABC transporter ATP-binding protein [Candidatus Nomurabacteria bacterium]